VRTPEELMKHIGLVGNSAEGAALCYRTIVAESLDILGGFHHPEVTLHTFSLDDYMCNLIGDDIDWEAAGRVLIRSAEKLKSIGADFALCPDNTIHHGVDLIRDEIPLPYLHICEVGARYAQEQGFKKVLITGTRYTMRGSIYERAFDAVGIGYVTPDDEEVRKLDQIIWEELIDHTIVPSSQEYYCKVIERYKEEAGCDAVVLGCTEIPLIVTPEISALPCIDSTRLLARKAIQIALGIEEMPEPLGAASHLRCSTR
jgi:aspartate racemase